MGETLQHTSASASRIPGEPERPAVTSRVQKAPAAPARRHKRRTTEAEAEADGATRSGREVPPRSPQVAVGLRALAVPLLAPAPVLGRAQARREVAELHDPAEREAESVAARLCQSPADAAPVPPLAQAAAAPMPLARELIPGAGQPLGRGVRALAESRFGYDFAAVRVHLGADAAELAAALAARAYTVGPHLIFAHGRYAPHTPDGLRLLYHELVHVVQQGYAGPLAPRLRIAARPRPLAVHRDAAPTEKPAPQQAPGPSEVPLDLVYVSERLLRSSRNGRDYVTFALSFFRDKTLVDNFLELFLSIHGKLPQAAQAATAPAPKRAYLRELTLVVHGWPDGSIALGINAQDRSKTRFPDELAKVRSQFQTDALLKEMFELVQGAMDFRTRVILRACNIGRNQSALQALRTLFGGRATVFAPRVWSFFSTDFLIAGRRGSGSERQPERPFFFAPRAQIDVILQQTERAPVASEADLLALCTAVPLLRNGRVVATFYYLPSSYLSPIKRPSEDESRRLLTNPHFIATTNDPAYWGYSEPEEPAPVPLGDASEIPSAAAPSPAPPAKPGSVPVPTGQPDQGRTQPPDAPLLPLPLAGESADPTPLASTEAATQAEPPPAPLSQEADAAPPDTRQAPLPARGPSDRLASVLLGALIERERLAATPMPLDDVLALLRHRPWPHFSEDEFAVKRLHADLAPKSGAQLQQIVQLIAKAVPSTQVLGALLYPPAGRFDENHRPLLTTLAAQACQILPALLENGPLIANPLQELTAARSVSGFDWAPSYALLLAAVAKAGGRDLLRPKEHTFRFVQSLYFALGKPDQQRFLEAGGDALQAYAFAHLSQGEREDPNLNLLDPDAREELRRGIRAQILAAQAREQESADPWAQRQRKRALLLLAGAVDDSAWAREQLPTEDIPRTDAVRRALGEKLAAPESGRHSRIRLAGLLGLQLDLATLPALVDELSGIRVQAGGKGTNVLSIHKASDRRAGLQAQIPELAIAALSLPLGAGKLQAGTATLAGLRIEVYRAGTAADPRAQVDLYVGDLYIRELLYVSPSLAVAIAHTELGGGAASDRAIELHVTLGADRPKEVWQPGAFLRTILPRYLSGLFTALSVLSGLRKASSLRTALFAHTTASLRMSGSLTLSGVESARGIGLDELKVSALQLGLGDGQGGLELGAIEVKGVHGGASVQALNLRGIHADVNTAVLENLLSEQTLRTLAEPARAAARGAAVGGEAEPAPSGASFGIDQVTATRLRVGDVPSAEELQEAAAALAARRRHVQGMLDALAQPRQQVRDWLAAVARGQAAQEALRGKALRPHVRTELQARIDAAIAEVDRLRTALQPSGFGSILKPSVAERAIDERAAAFKQKLAQLDRQAAVNAERTAQRSEYLRLLALPHLLPTQRERAQALRQQFRSPLAVEQLVLRAVRVSGELSADTPEAVVSGAGIDRVSVTATVAALDVSGLPAEQLLPLLLGRQESLRELGKIRPLSVEEQQEVAALAKVQSEYDSLDAALRSAQTGAQAAAAEQGLAAWSRGLLLRLRDLHIDGAASAREQLGPTSGGALAGSGVQVGLQLPPQTAGLEVVRRTNAGESSLARLSGLAASFTLRREGTDTVIAINKLGLDALTVPGLRWQGAPDQRLQTGSSGLLGLEVQGSLRLRDSGELSAHISRLTIDTLYATGLRAESGGHRIDLRADQRATLHNLFLLDFQADTHDDGRPLTWLGTLGLGQDRPDAERGLDLPASDVRVQLAELLRARLALSANQLVLQKKTTGELDVDVEGLQATAAGARLGRRAVTSASAGVEHARYQDDGKGGRTVELSLGALDVTAKTRYVAGGRTLELGSGSRLQGLEVAARLQYEYDRLAGEERLQRAEFSRLSVSGLRVRDGLFAQGDLSARLPLALFSNLHLVGFTLTRDQLGRSAYRGTIDLRGGFYAAAELQVRNLLTASTHIAAQRLSTRLTPGGHIILDAFSPSLASVDRFEVQRAGASPLALLGSNVRVSGLSVQQVDYYPGRYAKIQGGRIDRVSIPLGTYSGPLLFFGSPTPQSGAAASLRVIRGQYQISGELVDFHIGAAKLRFHEGILLERFGLGSIQLEGLPDGRDPKGQVDYGLRFTADGFSGRLAQINLGERAKKEGLLGDLKDVEFNPVGLAITNLFPTPLRPDYQQQYLLGGARTGTFRIVREAGAGGDSEATQSDDYYKLEPIQGEPFLELNDIKVRDLATPSGYELYLKKARVKGPIWISRDFSKYTVESFELVEGYAALDRLTAPGPKDQATVDSSIQKTNDLVSSIDSIVKQVEGRIFLRVHAGSHPFYATVFDDPDGLKVEQGLIKIPPIGTKNSPIFAKVESGVLVIALLTSSLPVLGLGYAGLAGAGALVDERVVKEIVLGGGLKLSADELEQYSRTGGFSYAKILHVLLDESAKPSEGPDVRIEIVRSLLRVAPAAAGAPAQPLAVAGFSGHVSQAIELGLSGTFDLREKQGALNVALRGELADAVLRDSNFTVGARQLSLSELTLSFWYANNKQHVRANLANLLLKKFKFRLG